MPDEIQEVRASLQHHALEIARLDKHVSVVETELKGVHREVGELKVTLKSVEEGLRKDIAGVRSMVAAASEHSHQTMTDMAGLREWVKGARTTMFLVNGAIVTAASILGVFIAVYRLGMGG
jgi:hypothetical protein